MVWAYICEKCNHEASRHRLVEGGDIKAGPYRCGQCACEISQDSPMAELDQRQYENYLRNRRVAGEQP